MGRARRPFRLTVRVTDVAKLSDDATATIDLLDVNESPTVTGRHRFLVPTDITPDTVVGVISAHDPDENDSLQFQIIEDPTNGAFTIAVSKGTLRVSNKALLATWPDPECGLVVSVTDSAGQSTRVEVTVRVRQNAGEHQNTPPKLSTRPTFGDESVENESPEQVDRGTLIGVVIGTIATAIILLLGLLFHSHSKWLLRQVDVRKKECRGLQSQLTESVDRCAQLETRNAELEAAVESQNV